MSASPSLVRIERLLRSPSLRLGANRFFDYGTEKVGADSFRVFVTHLESWASEINELILLENSEDSQRKTLQWVSDATFAVFAELAAKHKATQVWYVSPHCDEMHETAFAGSPGLRLTVTGPTQLFERILPLPAEFAKAAVSDVDLTDLNSYGYTIAFQRRAAVSTHVPLGVGRVEHVSSLDTELARWADSVNNERPILLLGDRGSGKTWQLLKFCEEQCKRSRKSPWLSPPAVYLSLRRILSYLADPQRSSLGLFGLLSDQSSWFQTKWNTAMFDALLESNGIVICLDGLDEVEIQPADADVRDHLRRVVSMLPMGSRFIISSRTTHFSSFDDLYSLETWPGADVNSTFRVLQLSPFQPINLSEYTRSFAAADPSDHALDALQELLSSDDDRDELVLALRRCSQQPALLARIVRDVKDSQAICPFNLLQSAIEGSLIEFNVQFERTRPLHLDRQGELRTFDARLRIAFLGELAWFMTERRLEAIAIDRLPTRLTRMFWIDTEPLERDIRSQTVFELVESFEAGGGSPPGGADAAMVGRPTTVRFGLRLNNIHPLKAVTAESSELLSRGTDAGRIRGSNKSDRISRSVSESYFLASHIAARLADSHYLPGVSLEDTLHFLGRVQLDNLTAAILRQMFGAQEDRGCGPAEIVSRAARHIQTLARQGGCRVFAKSLRYLFENLESLGFLSKEQRQLFEPWMPNLHSFVKCPSALGSYEFIFVPAPTSSKLAAAAAAAGAAAATRPFLLGIHEITNEQFEKFIVSPHGSDWTVDRITRAGRSGTTSPSPFASRTNEYHLYFWDEASDHSGLFRPPEALMRHPVVYVSWYVTQAYCNWLSEEDGKQQAYVVRDSSKEDPISIDLQTTGFRLPTAAEWWWSAQGPDDEVDYPWKLLPYPAKLPTDTSAPSDEPGAAAFEWFQQYRAAIEKVLLDSGTRSAEVAYDDDVGPFGAIGLIGNVKEWVQDIVVEPHTAVKKALVCGTTAHLGINSFRIGYYATLFPENTNPDVGFRLARSLSSEEYAVFQRREAELASLSDGEIENLSVEPGTITHPKEAPLT
jgi:formylglycine-generating enzyme required for sulfatase activity